MPVASEWKWLSQSGADSGLGQCLALLHSTHHCALDFREEGGHHGEDKDVAQEVGLVCEKPQVQSPVPHKPDMAAHTCNLSTWGLQAGGSGVWGLLGYTVSLRLT